MLTQGIGKSNSKDLGSSYIRLRSALVIAEVAPVLVGAGLTVRSFARLNSVNPGFSPEGVLTASISLPASKYPKPGQRVAFLRQLLQQLESTPGTSRRRDRADGSSALRIALSRHRARVFPTDLEDGFESWQYKPGGLTERSWTTKNTKLDLAGLAPVTRYGWR
jgi:hypothetical protein